mgnify:CR=1
MKKYASLGLHGINPETKIKLKLLSVALKKPMTDIVEEMTDKLWEENQNITINTVSQTRANKTSRNILRYMIPK